MKLRDQTSILTKKIGPLIGRLTVSQVPNFNKYCRSSNQATTLTLFKAKQQSMLRMDFETLTMFLQNDLCNISTTDDQFFVNIQKGIL